MSKILVLGAGLSSPYLIKYLAQHAKKDNYSLIVADASLDQAKKRIGKFANTTAIELDINNKKLREQLINDATLVVSLLPPTLHVLAAKDCIKFGKHLLTASYVSAQMQELHTDALKANVLLLNEMGLDPGIDHLSAMQIINDIKGKGGEITTFKSFCGGLVAPEFDNNPWNYKFTWNPKNVVLAGQASATYLENGETKFIPPCKIFVQTEDVLLPNHGKFESYANRDSLGYIKPYGIESAHTVLRGTLRRKGFSQSWQVLVNLGLTDDTLKIHDSHTYTNRKFLCAFVPGATHKNLEIQLCRYLNITQKSTNFKRIAWLGLFEPTPILLQNASAAEILLSILIPKWKLQPTDLDMVVLKHEIGYKLNKKNFKTHSSLVVKGEDATYTAMAKTVGLPMAIAARLILQNKIKLRGVQIPVYKEIYEPVLKELAKFDVKFMEE